MTNKNCINELKEAHKKIVNVCADIAEDKKEIATELDKIASELYKIIVKIK